MSNTTATSVLVIDDDNGRAALLEQSLRDQGYHVLARLTDSHLLAEQVKQLKPDMIIIELDSPDRDVLENMSLLNQESPRPVVMFAGESDSKTINKAIKAGVSAYIVDGMEPSRIRSILEVATARFREFQALRLELDETRTKLADRKLLDKAKGLIMSQHKCSEDEAFKALQRMAMNQQLPMSTVAQNIISVLELKP